MIDWKKFNEYLQSWGETAFLEAIRMFISDYPQNISTLRKNVEERNFLFLERNTHNLKSNCRFFGATEAAELALKLELMGKKHVDEEMDHVFGQLVIETGKLIQELEQYRNPVFPKTDSISDFP